MNTAMIVQAWKNPEYRASLSREQRVALPENPSGKPLTELDESELGEVSGGQLLKATNPDLCCFLSYVCPSFTLVCRDLDS